MQELIDYLEKKIEGCDALGGMEREKAVYQSVLKETRKQLQLNVVSGSFSATDVERAYDDGYSTDGEVTFDIDNYR